MTEKTGKSPTDLQSIKRKKVTPVKIGSNQKRKAAKKLLPHQFNSIGKPSIVFCFAGWSWIGPSDLSLSLATCGEL